MKVILLQELKGKGGEGDVVDVAPGFANTSLLPQKLAILATKGNLNQLEQRIADAEKMKAALEGATVKVEAKVGEEGQLFGSVTAVMIADAIKAATDLEVDKRRLELGHAIKTAGEHEVVYGIYRDIKVSVKLLVGNIDEPAEAEVAEETVEVVEEAEAPAEAAETATEE